MNNYSPRTKYEYRQTLKKFYKWLRNKDSPEETSWIKLNFKKNNNKLPSELLTEQDITAMVNFAHSTRDKAIIMGLYESGCRIGEFLKIRLRDIVFEKPGCIFIVNGKTGGRRIRVISSEPYLLDWINKHPDKNNPEAYLWVKNNSLKMLEYASFCKVLRMAARRAKVQKKINPHSFRHARATYLASRFTEQQLKVFFGWTRSSDMASVYVHLSGKDVDDALLDTYGIKKDLDENRISSLKPLICFMCNTQNEATNKFCKLCGAVLDEKLKNELLARETQNAEINKVMNVLFRDKDILALVAQKIREIKT
jgi:site-specific recombinase XerD